MDIAHTRERRDENETDIALNDTLAGFQKGFENLYNQFRVR